MFETILLISNQIQNHISCFVLVGHYIEVGQFQSVRTRAGIKWSKKLQNERKDTTEISEIQSTHLQIAQSQQTWEKLPEDILTNVKASIEVGINRVNLDIPVECLDKRNK